MKQKKTVKFTNAIINEVLLKLFANTEIAYEVNGQQVILSKKSEMPPQSKKSTLKGVILDVKGEPIIGATIRLEGNSSLGTISDYDGVYTLENVPEDGVVQISYIGYQPVSVAVNKAGSIVLKEDHQLLDEVVVIGYGVMNKRDVSTSISSSSFSTIAVRMNSALLIFLLLTYSVKSSLICSSNRIEIGETIPSPLVVNCNYILS